MKQMLLQDDVNTVEARLKHFETNTGCELLLVLAESSDEYPGAVWHFGVLFGFILTFIFSLFFDFHHSYMWPLSMALLSCLGVWIGHFPWAKKFTLSDVEMNRESHEKALEYFHTLGTSKVSHKVTAMIMVSVFEKKIIVLVDEKLKTKISQADLDELVALMQTHFKNGNMGLGFTQSIDNLEQKILNNFNGKVSDANSSELKDILHFV